MSIRATIDRHKRTSTIVAIVVAIGAIGLIIWQRSPSRPNTEITGSYYTTDDGASWFVDDFDKVVPFDHNGSPAYRLMFYKCGDNGTPTPVFMERYPDAVGKKLSAMLAMPPEQRDGAQMMDIGNRVEVKRPGEAKWYSILSPQGQKIFNVQSLSGCNGVPMPAFPAH